MVKKRIYVPLLTYPDVAKDSLLDNAVELARDPGATICATVIEVSIPPITNPCGSVDPLEQCRSEPIEALAIGR